MTPRPRLVLLLGAMLALVYLLSIWLQGRQSDTQAVTPPAFESMVPAPPFEPAPKVIFKWQDESGAWHFGDTPPAEGVNPELTLSPAAGPTTLQRPDS